MDHLRNLRFALNFCHYMMLSLILFLSFNGISQASSIANRRSKELPDAKSDHSSISILCGYTAFVVTTLLLGYLRSIIRAHSATINNPLRFTPVLDRADSRTDNTPAVSDLNQTITQRPPHY